MPLYKLGKKPAVHDPRTLQLANYLKTEDLPPIPPKVDWSAKVSVWGMMKNDKVGDCTCAGAGHIVQDWTANVDQEVTIPDDQIIAAYSAISGYDPRTGANDNGAYCIDALNYWRQTGIGNHRIEAYAALEPKSRTHVKASILLFGAIYLGVALPISAQNQDVWNVVPGFWNNQPGSWGGHCVCCVAYDEYTITCVTWGALKKMTWRFFEKYCDEGFAVFGSDWIHQITQKSPGGFASDELLHDLTHVTG